MSQPSNFGEQVFLAVATNNENIEGLKKLLSENSDTESFTMSREAVERIIHILEEDNAIIRFFDKNVEIGN